MFLGMGKTRGGMCSQAVLFLESNEVKLPSNRRQTWINSGPVDVYGRIAAVKFSRV